MSSAIEEVGKALEKVASQDMTQLGTDEIINLHADLSSLRDALNGHIDKVMFQRGLRLCVGKAYVTA